MGVSRALSGNRGERSFSIGLRQLIFALALSFLALIPARPAAAQVQQSIALEQGWNAISFRVRPTEKSFPSIFNAIASNVALVKDQNGRVYSPEYLIDSLSPWDSTRAYLVLARTSTTLQVNGYALDPAAIKLTLNKGWNMIPYLPSSQMTVKEAFAPIQDKVVLVKNADGKVYSPSQGIDAIGMMVPGQGYHVYMSDVATFSYGKSASTVPAPTPAPAPAPPSEGAATCLASANAHSVMEFGPFTPSLTDAATVKANTATLNKAIDQVGASGGGTICLPGGHYYLSPADTTKLYTYSVYINRDNITLWGAGKYADQGGTALHTRGRWSLVNGQVMRGVGIWIKGTSSSTAPRRNIMLRDFELDGGSGYTGVFSWPANPLTGDGWDVTHKGIMLSSNDNVDDLTLQDMYVHSYKGEVLYAGGSGLGDFYVRRVKVEDTNASTINFTARFVIEDSEFGRSSIWFEVGTHFKDKSGIIRNSYFHDAARFGLNFAQGDYERQPYLVEGNKFENCGSQAIFLGGGIEGPVDIRNNEFVNCSLVATGYGGAGGKESRNITIENNTVSGVKGDGFYLSSQASNIIIRNNKITAGRSGGYCCSALNNIVVEGNTFVGLPPKEYGSGIAAGERPLFRNNTYTGGPFYQMLSKASPVYKPYYEVGAIQTSDVDYTIVLDTSYFPDGQPVRFVVGSASKPIRFAAGSASYFVAADRILKPNESLWMRYNKAASRWEEFTP